MTTFFSLCTIISTFVLLSSLEMHCAQKQKLAVITEHCFCEIIREKNQLILPQKSYLDMAPDCILEFLFHFQLLLNGLDILLYML